MIHYKRKNDLLLYSRDLIKAFSEIRAESFIPGICFKVLLRANFDLPNLAAFDVSKILSMKKIVEIIEDIKQIINADNNDEAPWK